MDSQYFRPPRDVVMLVLVSFGLVAALLFLPGLTERMELDQLAFGMAFCVAPFMVIALIVRSIRAKGSVDRAWSWAAVTLVIGAALTLVVTMTARLEGGISTRSAVVLLCIAVPLAGLPLIPAAICGVRAWREARGMQRPQ